MRTTRLSFNGESKKWIGHTAARTWESASGAGSPRKIDEVQLWLREKRGQGRLELQEEPHREALRRAADKENESFLDIQARMLAGSHAPALLHARSSAGAAANGGPGGRCDSGAATAATAGAAGSACESGVCGAP